jgi:predicted dehydrogenase
MQERRRDCMNMKLKIGLVGLGYAGRIHLKGYLNMDNVDFIAVVDINAQSIVKDLNYDLKTYKNIDELLEKETLDAVDICLPTKFHKETVIKALNNGVNVLVEKPFALNLNDIDEMIEASVRTSKRLMVAHVCRFMHEYVFAKQIIDNNTLGRPLFYYASRNSATPNWSVNNWLGDKKQSGGTVMDLQIHDIDIANWLLGEPTGFKMVEVNNPALGTSNFGHIVSTIKYGNDGYAVLEAGHLMPQAYPFSTAYRLICEKGVLEFSKGSSINFTLYKQNEKIDMTEDYKAKYAGISPYHAELTHFADCIVNNKEFAITLYDARNAVYTVNKLNENAF